MKKKKNKKKISTEEFDRQFDENKDISDYLSFEDAIVVKRINIDLPQWIIDQLDKEALMLNVSRQAIIKLWLRERLERRQAA